MGCLTLVVIVGALVYLGMHVGQPYYRYYTFRDAVKQEARFATLRSDDAIKQTLWAAADSLELPEAAYHLTITRRPRFVRITGSYRDTWTLWKYTRSVQFHLDIQDEQ